MNQTNQLSSSLDYNNNALTTELAIQTNSFADQEGESSNIPNLKVGTDQIMDFTLVTLSRHLTTVEMEQTLHITKLYLVELEDKPSNATPEKLQYHQQLLDHLWK
jgi:hypothetical protein